MAWENKGCNEDNIDFEIDNVNYIDPKSEPLQVEPKTEEQEFIPEKYTYYNKVNVNKVTSDIDKNIKPNNIKKGIEILGVVGQVEVDRPPLIFNTQQDFFNWLNGSYTRPDGKTPNDLKLADEIYIRELNVPDYWYADDITKPITIDNFSPLETKIDLTDYLKKVNEQEKVYATDRMGNQITLQYNETPYGNGLAKRTNDGRLKGATPTENDDLVNKEYFDANKGTVVKDYNGNSLAEAKFEGTESVEVDMKDTDPNTFQFRVNQTILNDINNKQDKLKVGHNIIIDDTNTISANTMVAIDMAPDIELLKENDSFICMQDMSLPTIPTTKAKKGDIYQVLIASPELEVLNLGNIGGKIVETINVSSWTAEDNDPYKFYANITLKTPVKENTLVELVNDNAIAFGKYGFAILSIIGQDVKVVAIEEIKEPIDLTFFIGG